MVRALISAVKPTIAGVVPTDQVVIAADGLKFVNNGVEYLWIENGNASSLTVTAKVPPSRTVYGQTVPDKTWTIATGTKKMIGPFPPELFRRNQGESGGDPFMTYLDFSVGTTVKATLISIN